MNPLAAHLAVVAVLLLASCQATRPFDPRTDIPQIASPPGVLWLRDSLFLGEAEVTNISWLEYLFYIRRDSGEAFYRSQLPDSASWLADLGSADPYIQYYFRYPGFRHFPVLGLSQPQAVAYCRWRSDMVNKRLWHTTLKLLTTGERRLLRRAKKAAYTYTVEYRLPMTAEWMEAATDAEWPHLRSDWPARQRRSLHRYFQPKPLDSARMEWLRGKNLQLSPADRLDRLAYHLLDEYWLTASRLVVPTTEAEKEWLVTGYHSDSPLPPFPEYAHNYPPSARGFYNIIGNVAEMTATPGVAKGGSFKHTLAEAEPSRSQTYTGPCSWVGFRCACVVHVRPLPREARRR